MQDKATDGQNCITAKSFHAYPIFLNKRTFIKTKTMSIIKIISIAKQDFSQIQSERSQMIKAIYKLEFSQKEEDSTDDFYCWYYLRYYYNYKKPNYFNVFWITLPKEAEGSIKTLKVHPADLGEDGSSEITVWEDPMHWSVFGYLENNKTVCLADCHSEDAAIDFHKLLTAQLQSIRSHQADDFLFTPRELLKAMSLSIYGMIGDQSFSAH
jgi:hypothetical protein